MKNTQSLEIVELKELNKLDFNILPEIKKLNFDRIKFKMLQTDEKYNTKDLVDHAELEYKRYLTLIKLHPSKSIVPSKMMDDFWHMHILDTQAYREDCQKVFGRFIDHFPYFGIYGEDDRHNLLKEFENTKQMYFERFGIQILDSSESRCEHHACHAPSSCACRVEGACKSL